MKWYAYTLDGVIGEYPTKRAAMKALVTPMVWRKWVKRYGSGDYEVHCRIDDDDEENSAYGFFLSREDVARRHQVID